MTDQKSQIEQLERFTTLLNAENRSRQPSISRLTSSDDDGSLYDSITGTAELYKSKLAPMMSRKLINSESMMLPRIKPGTLIKAPRYSIINNDKIKHK